MLLDWACYDEDGGGGIGVVGRNASPLCVLTAPIPHSATGRCLVEEGGVMPIYTVSIHKRLHNEPHGWSNQYFVTAADDIAAADIGDDILFVETSVHRESVDFYQMNVRQAGTGHLGIQRGISLSGTAPVPGGSSMLPLWNVAMFSMSSGVDRNDRKFLRLPLYADDCNGQILNDATKADFDLLYSANLLLVGGLVNTWGRPFVNCSCSGLVHDRDVTWQRQTRPGFHRGWVPD